MAFGKSGNADAEASGVRVAFEISNKPDEARRLREDVSRMVVVRLVVRGISAQGEDIADAGSGVALED